MANTWDGLVEETQNEMNDEVRKLGGVTRSGAADLVAELADSAIPNSKRDAVSILLSNLDLGNYTPDQLGMTLHEIIGLAIRQGMCQELTEYAESMQSEWDDIDYESDDAVEDQA